MSKTIKFNDKSYNIDKAALSTATNDLIAHLATIAGEGVTLVIGGVQYNVDPTKLAAAASDLEVAFGELSGSEGGGNISGSDTLTVDWDAFEPTVVATCSVGGVADIVKVSDVTPTLDDFVNSGTFVYYNSYTKETKEETFSYEEIVSVYDECGLIGNPNIYFMVAPYDNFTADIPGFAIFTFPEKGVYFFKDETMSLTINGYNGF